MHIDAVTGEVIDPELLIEQLTKHANALPVRAKLGEWPVALSMRREDFYDDWGR